MSKRVSSKFGSFQDIESRTTTRRSVYTLREQVRQLFVRPVVGMHRIDTADGERFRVLELRDNSLGSIGRKIFDRTLQVLRLYESVRMTPHVVYSDSDHIVLNWISGNSLAETSVTAQEYFDLGAFTVRGFREIEHNSGTLVSESVTTHLAEISTLTVLEEGVVSGVTALLESIGQLRPAHASTAICFADTVSKNFLRSEAGKFFYIDVMGIGRQSIGAVFAKQLSMIPVGGRRQFFDSYVETFSLVAGDQSYSLIEDLPFYFSEFVIGKLLKSLRVRRMSRINRGQVAASIVSEFSKVQGVHDDVVDWILDEAETMV